MDKKFRNMPHQQMPSIPDYDNAIPRTQNLVPGTCLPRPHVSYNRNPNEMPYSVIEHSASSSIARYAPDDGYLTVGPNLSQDSNSSYGVVTSPGQVHMGMSLPEVSTISHDANLTENRTHSTRHILLALGVATLIIIGIGVAVYIRINVVDGSSEEITHGPEKQVGSVDGIWSKWQEWSQCSATCGDGTITLTRICNNPPPSKGGQDCGNMDTNVTTCKVVDCPVDGHWADWKPWSQCSETCGLGTRTRNRTCENPRPQHNGKDCIGEGSESSSCGNAICPSPGIWGTWTEWNDCSTSCGPGVSSRSRVCDKSGGGECTGSATDTKVCQTLKCYDNWGDWSACSFTCGPAIKTRTRTCDGKYTEQECGVQVPTFLDQTSCTNTHSCSVAPFCQDREADCAYKHPNRCDLFITCDHEKNMHQSACNVLLRYEDTGDCAGICNFEHLVPCP